VRVSTATSDSTTGAGYLRAEPFDADDRFRDELGVSQSIVASLGQGDHGLFEVNLGDLRYLPFERRGVISTWKLELTAALPAFDYESISDVVFALRYTARDGGEALKTACLDAITDALQEMTTGSGATGLVQAFSVRHEFADAWYRFVNPLADASLQTLELPLDETYFPYQFQGSDIRISGLSLYLLPKQGADPVPTTVSVDVSLANGADVSGDLSTATQPAGSYAYRPYLFAEGIALAGSPDVVTITTPDSLTEETIDNLILAFSYEIS
jgi:Tc toxin complex TcA C-terminal TcB-binding domain